MKNTRNNYPRNTYMVIAIIGVTLTMLSTTSFAQSSDPFYSTAGSNNCYRQANMAIAGENPATLSTAGCKRALKNKPLSQQQKTEILYNRGMIELARGDVELARESLEMSVALANKVGLPHLVLARLTFKQGDYLASANLYQALLDSGLESPDLARNKQAIVHNQKMAIQAASNDRLARHAQ